MGKKSEKFQNAFALFLDRLREKSPDDSEGLRQSHGDSLLPTDLKDLIQVWNGESISQPGRYSTSPKENPQIPKQIDRFQILSLVGQGGFGSVYLANDSISGRKVALKVLHASRADERDRFLREAYLLSQIRHPSIVSCFDYGRIGEQLYFVMEYVEGSSLAQMISSYRRFAIQSGKQNPLDFTIELRNKNLSYGEFLLQMMQDIAHALGYAHQQGILHRDLKPDNILIEESGRILLGDFGLACRETAIAPSENVGTLPYMAPELFRGEAPISASDIFSFGATFYETLTLRRAFEGFDSLEIKHSILNLDSLAPRKINPAISEDLEQILMKCLEKDAAKRYANGTELARDLDQLISGKPLSSSARIAESRRTKNILLWVSVAALAGLSVFAIRSFDRESKPQENSMAPARPSTQAPDTNPTLEREDSTIPILEKIQNSDPRPMAPTVKVYIPETALREKENSVTLSAEKLSTPKETTKPEPAFNWRSLNSDSHLNLIFAEGQIRSLSSMYCRKASQLTSTPPEMIAWESVPPIAFVGGYSDSYKWAQVDIAKPNIASSFANLLIEEYRRSPKRIAFLEDIPHPYKGETPAYWQWAQISSFVGLVHHELQSKGIDCFVSLKFPNSYLSISEAQQLAQHAEGFQLTFPFYSSSRSSQDKLLNEMSALRGWLDQKKLIRLVPIDSENFPQHRSFLAAMAMLLRKKGDPIFVWSTQTYEEENWPERFGPAKGTWELRGSIFRRDFEKATLWVDHSAELDKAIRVDWKKKK